MPPCPALGLESLEEREVPAAAFDSLPIFNFADPGVLDHARAIAAIGRSFGRNPNAFAKVGDSNSSPSFGFAPAFLIPLGALDYDAEAAGLAERHPELLDTLAAYREPLAGLGINSFARDSTAAVAGATARFIFSTIPGELAATNAAVALVMIGTNDAFSHVAPATFRAELDALIGALVSAGVVPILSTVPENRYLDGAATIPTRELNQVIADVAADDRLPLVNTWRELAALPEAGLDQYGVHLTASPAGGGSFHDSDLAFGQNVRNLDSLIALDWFREQIAAGVPTAMPFPTWTPLAPGAVVYAVGFGEGQAPVVSIFDATSRRELNRFLAFEPTFGGGVRVALGDVDGDGIDDVVAGAGPGGGPAVRAFSGADGRLLASFYAYESTFRGGVSSVSAADLDGDGVAEIVVGAGLGGGPAIAVFHGGDYAEVERFMAFESTFRGGVNVAASADLAGFGPAIVAGAGVGGGPIVKVFHLGESEPVASFFAFEPAVRYGVAVAVGDLTGDGPAELVVAPAAVSTRVRVLDMATSEERRSFFAGKPTTLSGVRLAVRNGALLIGNGPGEPLGIRAYDGLGETSAILPPSDPVRAFGIFVA